MPRSHVPIRRSSSPTELEFRAKSKLYAHFKKPRFQLQRIRYSRLIATYETATTDNLLLWDAGAVCRVRMRQVRAAVPMPPIADRGLSPGNLFPHGVATAGAAPCHLMWVRLSSIRKVAGSTKQRGLHCPTLSAQYL